MKAGRKHKKCLCAASTLILWDFDKTHYMWKVMAFWWQNMARSPFQEARLLTFLSQLKLIEMSSTYMLYCNAFRDMNIFIKLCGAINRRVG